MYRLCIVFLCVFTANCVLSNEGSVSKSCTETQTPFELSELKFSFDLNKISRINVLNGDAASSVISFKNDWLPQLHVITTSEDHVSGGLNANGGYKKLGVSDIQELFSKIKNDTSNDEFFLKVKSVFGLTNTSNIEIKNYDSFDLYILSDVFDHKDAVYIFRDNDPRIIMLVADFTKMQLRRVLDHICI